MEAIRLECFLCLISYSDEIAKNIGHVGQIEETNVRI